MIARLRAAFGQTAIGLAAVIWGFAYVLLDIVSALLGRSAPGLILIASIPMFILGVGQTIALDRLRKGMRSYPPTTRWPALVFAVVVASAVQSLFDFYWVRTMSLAFFPLWQEWALDGTLQRLLTAGVLYLWTFSFALTLFWAGRAQATAARAEASRLRAEATALRLQLNPHFLFNTLNSISSAVVLRRNEDAEEMIDRLCSFLRASLDGDPMADVPLTQEMDSIDAYLGIEAARFGERLEIAIEVDETALDARVPNFILQPLVENAIKHGVGAVKGPARLEVAAVREAGELVLSVLNGSGNAERSSDHVDPPPTRRGIGLANTRQRLANRYGEHARLETGPTPEGYRAVIRMPFVRTSRRE